MPRGIYSIEFNRLTKLTYLEPQPHQKFVLEAFQASPHKGMLLFHRLGSGKTCTSYYIAETMLRTKQINRVFIFTPGSLRNSWVKEYGNAATKRKRLARSYIFVTYNYSVFRQLPENIDNSLVIIDECHNFINSVKNKSDNAYEIYKLIDRSKCRVLLLSGTPIYNNLYEFPIFAQLLKPGVFPDVLGQKSDDVDGNMFLNWFNTDSTTGKITAQNQEEFDRKMSGIISYFPGLSESLYPRVIIHPVVKTEMLKEQWEEFDSRFTIENKILAAGMPSRKDPQYLEKKLLFVIATKRAMSRQASNFMYPPHINEIDKNYIQSVYAQDGRAKEIRESIPKDLLASQPQGWVSEEYFGPGQLETMSPKFKKILDKILEFRNSKHMVFSFLKTRAGVHLLSSILQLQGIPCALFSGDMNDKQRTKILDTFNKVENREGKLITVILVTYAGAEGINLLETQHVHIMDSDPRELKIQQVIGRAVRFKSHINMPKENRVVNVWRYWSVSPQSTKLTVDEMLYVKGETRMNMINSFIDMMVRNSIE